MEIEKPLGILASTRKINLESYSLVLEVFASEVATFEIKVRTKKYGFVLILYLFLELYFLLTN